MAAATTLKPLARALLRSQPDARLVVLAREGREDAFAEIVRRYRGPLVPFAAAYCPRDQAEDVVQESFTRAWSSLRESDSEIHLSGWLHTIVRNRALNARRDTRAHAELDEASDGVRQPTDIVLSREELAQVVSAVQALPASQREALVRSALEGHSHEQIASSLETSPGAVRQLIFRARHGLRESFGLIIPLPLIRVLTEVTTDQAIAGGAGTAGAAAAAAGVGGSSIGLKAVTVIAVGATVAGSGIAIDRSRHDKDPRDRVAAASVGGPDSRTDGPRSSGTSSQTGDPAELAAPTAAAESAGAESEHDGDDGDSGEGSSSGSEGSGSGSEGSSSGSEGQSSGGGSGDDAPEHEGDGDHSGDGGGAPGASAPPPSGGHEGGELDGEDEDGDDGSSGGSESPESDDDGDSGHGSGFAEPIEPDDELSGDSSGSGDDDDSHGSGSGTESP